MSSWIHRGLAFWLVIVLPTILGTTVYIAAPVRNVSAVVLWSLAFTMFVSWLATGVTVRTPASDMKEGE